MSDKQAVVTSPPAEERKKRERKGPEPGTEEFKVYARERAEKFHAKTRVIRDLTRKYGMGPMELAKYCGFADERGFRPLSGPEIQAKFDQAVKDGKVQHKLLPEDQWKPKREKKAAEVPAETPTPELSGDAPVGNPEGIQVDLLEHGVGEPLPEDPEQDRKSLEAAIIEDTQGDPQYQGDLSGVDLSDPEEGVAQVNDQQTFVEDLAGDPGQTPMEVMAATAEAGAAGALSTSVQTLVDWFKKQTPGSDRMKLAAAFYDSTDELITQRAAAEKAGLDLKSNFSGRCGDLAKALVIERGTDDKAGRAQWYMTDDAIEAWEVLHPPSA